MNKEYIHSGRANQKQETRDRILKSAQYFLKKGADFNLEDVAQKTGVSRATIYRYFSNAEILAAEAGLDINTLSPEVVFQKFQEKSLEERILGIQDYFNLLAIENENAFRKYLSVVLVSNSPEIKRGARRKKTLRLALKNADLDPDQKEDLANLLTILMGIEPLIVAKDVAGLNNEESMRLMTWGMKLILKSYFESINN